jgi:hypothetical protein
LPLKRQEEKILKRNVDVKNAQKINFEATLAEEINVHHSKFQDFIMKGISHIEGTTQQESPSLSHPPNLTFLIN